MRPKSSDPLELYDFFYDSYRHAPNERLLEFLANAGDIDALRELPARGAGQHLLRMADVCAYGADRHED